MLDVRCWLAQRASAAATGFAKIQHPTSIFYSLLILKKKKKIASMTRKVTTPVSSSF
jgi:hypothetical protein